MTTVGAERDPDEQEILMRAFHRAKALLATETVGNIIDKPVADYTDDEALALGFGILGHESFESRKYHPEWKQKCGWCVEAAGNDQAAWDNAVDFDDRAAVRNHTLTCEHNPIVVERDRLKQAVMLVLASVAFANDEADGDTIRGAVSDFLHADPSGMEFWLDALKVPR